MNATTHTQGELKACPFCGGEAAVESESCGWRVHCIERGCHTAGPWPDDCTEAEAITAWNHRTVDTELLEALKNAREALCNHACHGGNATPCIRSNEQCRSECGKQAGDAIVMIDAAITKATGHG